MVDDSAEERLWQATYDARQKYFETTVGPFPPDILKMLSMSGVWPGGGLVIIPAGKIRQEMAVYTTFGFTNSDMPTRVKMTDFHLESEGGRATQAKGSLQAKEPARKKSGAAGYGYEIFVIAEQNSEWPLSFLQWAVNAEIDNDAGLLARVEDYHGLTVEQIDVGPKQSIDVLITKTEAPLPTGTDLPNGRMDLLVATVITNEEMVWSMENGRSALLRKLRDAGVGQISSLSRRSVG
jgi:hypothetical protein